MALSKDRKLLAVGDSKGCVVWEVAKLLEQVPKKLRDCSANRRNSRSIARNCRR